ncbi:MAG: hypothetical protein JSV66_04940 [Trueperaceae bacterium]|nr:MAG: hypothetical protein JSV66_04940 [Trueperaceae bacterium]
MVVLKIFGFAVMFSILIAFSSAFASGPTVEELEQEGWGCNTAGPRDWVHCLQQEPGAASILVLVFGVDRQPFLGSELLVRDDVYFEQPCAEEGGGPYELVDIGGVDYRACHFFDTGSTGPTVHQLEHDGWGCNAAGPRDWVHCLQEEPGAASILVLVFDVDQQPFLGSEILVRDDVYFGQPCAEEGGGPYELVDIGGVDYRACHNFDTSAAQ